MLISGDTPLVRTSCLNLTSGDSLLIKLNELNEYFFEYTSDQIIGMAEDLENAINTYSLTVQGSFNYLQQNYGIPASLLQEVVSRSIDLKSQLDAEAETNSPITDEYVDLIDLGCIDYSGFLSASGITLRRCSFWGIAWRVTRTAVAFATIETTGPAGVVLGVMSYADTIDYACGNCGWC